MVSVLLLHCWRGVVRDEQVSNLCDARHIADRAYWQVPYSRVESTSSLSLCSCCVPCLSNLSFVGGLRWLRPSWARDISYKKGATDAETDKFLSSHCRPSARVFIAMKIETSDTRRIMWYSSINRRPSRFSIFFKHCTHSLLFVTCLVLCTHF